MSRASHPKLFPHPHPLPQFGPALGKAEPELTPSLGLHEELLVSAQLSGF